MGRIGGIYADGKKSWIEKIDRKNIKKLIKNVTVQYIKREMERGWDGDRQNRDRKGIR